MTDVQMTPYTLTHHVDDDVWIAHALAFDLVASGTHKDEAIKRLQTVLAAQIAWGKAHGISLSRCYFGAPIEDWRLPVYMMPMPSDAELEQFRFSEVTMNEVEKARQTLLVEKDGLCWAVRPKGEVFEESFATEQEAKEFADILAEWLADYARSRERETYIACCKRMCSGCDDEMETRLGGAHVWHHYVGQVHRFRCLATEIRSDPKFAELLKETAGEKAG